MTGLKFVRTILLAALLFTGAGLSLAPAHAASPTPQQIQALIASGHPGAALSDLRDALRAHPQSGVAWYLKAEAEDATGHVAAARSSLARAEAYAPGLPFADPGRVAALKAHLAAGPAAARGGAHIHPAVLIIGGLVVLFLLVRWLGNNRRRAMQAPWPGTQGYGPGYGPGGVPPNGAPPYGAPGGGMGGGFGGGLGSSLMTGLAAGAGFAAGERIIDGLTGGHGGAPMVDPNGGNMGGDTGGTPPDRDDGLLGNPGWDNGDAGGGNDFDPDNNW
ncbi:MULTISPECIES: tetratricopeptide repeat protein [unclassified Acidiphilium]|uniref:tetratricopeptide repeat protein n=1 Tax=unclassified Acidiphilium TaxID=2617493 RepID=UPI000BC89AC7|nr:MULTISPECIES: tetratricopeptide repeat protein [unclassified Acidiphilium]OYV55308.1 MAG: hypothetical protein B7Z76_10820 [Acidiphilium sp. 20-67-58]HQT61023.1 tetratricopeptide repeat protein [Acidiphilium sp.]